jgi:hypothetical protein
MCPKQGAERNDQCYTIRGCLGRKLLGYERVMVAICGFAILCPLEVFAGSS